MKKIIISIFVLCSFLLIQTEVYAAKAYEIQIKKGIKQLNEQNYTLAITSFKKAVKLAPNNIEAREELAKAYISQAYRLINKENEWGKAAIDYRNALFYLQYYNPKLNNSNIDMLISNTESNRRF